MHFRDRLLRTITLTGVLIVVLTELLGLFEAIRLLPLAAAWFLVAIGSIAAAARYRLQLTPPVLTRDPVVWLSLAGIAVILTLTAVSAGFSPPNSSDAMAYHMPRVFFWAQQHSVRFFPTQYLNQIMLQPFAEYAMLHTYVLSGGDRCINFVQWLASLVSIAGVSAVAREFGAKARGQVLAALFCATLPAGVLASSGAKNDYVMAMWLILSVYFACRFAASRGYRDALFLGVALGLAFLTKATAYLFAPWLIAALLLPRIRRHLRGLALTLACSLLLNTAFYSRNFQLSGNPLGFDSAHGDGFFRWRNETFGWKQTLSNLLRHGSEQIGDRADGWNRGVYNIVASLHSYFEINLNDPATTWPWATYEPPRNANHEANAPNRWHLAILLAVALGVFLQSVRRRDLQTSLYSVALVLGLIAFCAYLKWQPFMARLLLPLYVAAAPLIALPAASRPHPRYKTVSMFVAAALCLFLLDNARRPALENWVRPLKGPRSVLRVPREKQYFADLTSWKNAQSYQDCAQALAAGSCATVGLDITRLQIEYPLEALLRARKPATKFLHTGVENVSKQYAQPTSAPPCAIVCFDCLDAPERLRLYSGFPKQTAFGLFVVLEQK